MERRMTIRSVSQDTIDRLHELREEEGRFFGRIINDAVQDYWLASFEECED